MLTKYLNQIIITWSGIVALCGLTVILTQPDNSLLKVTLVWVLTALIALMPLEVLHVIFRRNERER